MKSNELIVELRKRNHVELYHSCTVPTFQSYCKCGGYRSRKTIEEKGFSLTRQYSDKQDQEMRIYDCLFLNIFDIHYVLKSICLFGPIHLVFDIEALREAYGDVKSYRMEISNSEYDPASHEINDLSDLCTEAFMHGTSNLPNKTHGKRGALTSVYFSEGIEGIPFDKYLKKVVVDSIPDYTEISNHAKIEIAKYLKESCLNIPVIERECKQCKCFEQYSRFDYYQIYSFFYYSNEEIRKLRHPESLGAKPITRNTRGMIDEGYTMLCQGCGCEEDVWIQRIDSSIYLDCPNCGFYLYSSGGDSLNKCSYCDEGVYFSEEKIFKNEGMPDDKAVKCSKCGVYCHINCAEEDLETVETLEDFVCCNCQ